jgi:hypothetical protein
MPNCLLRSDFPTFGAYTYYSVWRRFIIRESQPTDLNVAEDASEDEIQKLRIMAGVCICDVTLNPKDRSAVFPSSARCVFKPKQQLWLSRVSAEKDWFRHPLEIKEVTNTSTVIFTEKTIFPEDAAEGKWTLDLVHNQSQASQQLHHVQAFALKPDDALHKLVVDDLLHETEALQQAQQPPGPTSCRKDLNKAAAVHGLDVRQTEALWQVSQNRCSLIQRTSGHWKNSDCQSHCLCK